MDLFEEVGEDALGFLASAGGGELGGDGAEVIQRPADFDQAVVQLVDGFGIFKRIVVLVDVGLLVVDVDRVLPAAVGGAS